MKLFTGILAVLLFQCFNYILSATLHTKFYVGKHANFSWPKPETALSIRGNITLGALHMVHENSVEHVCGAIINQGGIQALEVMLYTLDYINARADILPGISLGMLAKDDCDRETYGLEQSVDFIRGSVAITGGPSYTCEDGSTPDLHSVVIPGVIGAPSSDTSVQVSNLLKLFRIPQVSFFSTSTVLSRRERYRNFLRTIPSDVYQARAMVDLVKRLKWTYVSVIFEETNFGTHKFHALEDFLKRKDICVALTEKLRPHNTGISSEVYYDRIVVKLIQNLNAKGVIIFGNDMEVGELMKAVRRRNATFSWIGIDDWGGRGLAYIGNEAQVEGALSLQPLAYEVQGFKEYFLNLSPFNNKRNPWFIEFWEQHFQCKFPDTYWTPYNEDYNTTCTGLERIEPGTFNMGSQLQFVSQATLAFVYALHNMHTDLCGPTYRGVCAGMDPVDGERLLQYVTDVNFTDLSGRHFQFLSKGDGPPKYRVLNYRQTTPGIYKWETVGFYDNGHLTNIGDLKYRLDQPVHPDSVCSYDCEQGEATVFLEDGSECCWTCVKCNEYQYMPTPYECGDCSFGWKPNEDKSRCVLIPIVYLQFDDGLAIGAVAFSTTGIVITAFVTIIFLKYNSTPVVKASGRDLSFVLLVGIFLCYSMSFVLILKPSDVVCGAQKFGIGLCFTVCYSSVLIKTNRISRIFSAGKRTVTQPKYISPQSQLFITGAIIAFQILVGVTWMLFRPPEAIFYYADRADHQLVCKDAVGGYYMVGFSFPIILVFVCTVYAILTRNIPEAFNESKYIGFSMYTTCIIWLAFVPIYFSTAYNMKFRIATLCFSISLSATVLLVCMFSQKLYIILRHPEKNVRKSMVKQITSST